MPIYDTCLLYLASDAPLFGNISRIVESGQRLRRGSWRFRRNYPFRRRESAAGSCGRTNKPRL